MSFADDFPSSTSQSFPYGTSPVIAPYWARNDVVGDVRYTVYTTENGSSYIDQVNEFLANGTDNFIASMLLVAQWIDVCPYDYYYYFYTQCEVRN